MIGSTFVFKKSRIPSQDIFKFASVICKLHHPLRVRENLRFVTKCNRGSGDRKTYDVTKVKSKNLEILKSLCDRMLVKMCCTFQAINFSYSNVNK